MGLEPVGAAAAGVTRRRLARVIIHVVVLGVEERAVVEHDDPEHEPRVHARA
jgi:hypothetical protein